MEWFKTLLKCPGFEIKEEGMTDIRVTYAEAEHLDFDTGEILALLKERGGPCGFDIRQPYEQFADETNGDYVFRQDIRRKA